ncbi:hypothetical protein VKS41_006009 [Umbelopsis sp. WA50703]
MLCTATPNTQYFTPLSPTVLQHRLPQSLTDYFAQIICDLLPTSTPQARSALVSLPELLFFIEKVTHRAGVTCKVIVYAMIYLERAKEALPKGAVGNYDTTHRLFLASLLLASKFLEEDMESDANNSLVASIPRLNGKRLRDLCGGIYTLKDINTFELSFLKLIKYRCWVDQDDVESFLRRNSVELQLY